MRVPLRSSFWVKSAEVLLLVVAVCFSMGASSAGSRFNDLGDRLMCQCGCAQLLGECDHVGCPSRGQEMADLKAQISAGKTDQQIMNWFAVKYGATVLAAPPARGFDLLAWIAPFAVFGAALLGTPRASTAFGSVSLNAWPSRSRVRARSVGYGSTRGKERRPVAVCS